MKKFETPDMEVVKFDVADIITTSSGGGTTSPGGGTMLPDIEL